MAPFIRTNCQKLEQSKEFPSKEFHKYRTINIQMKNHKIHKLVKCGFAVLLKKFHNSHNCQKYEGNYEKNNDNHL